MENVVLVIHLMLALGIIAVVLLQRSEGGGLGMGGGGGVMTGRGAATALGRATWWLAGAFMVTSLGLTIIAAENAGGASVVDRITDAPAPAAPVGAVPGLGDGSLLPPVDGLTPLVPAPAPDAAPATEAPAADAPPRAPAPAAETQDDAAAAFDPPAEGEAAPDAAPAETPAPAGN